MVEVEAGRTLEELLEELEPVKVEVAPMEACQSIAISELLEANIEVNEGISKGMESVLSSLIVEYLKQSNFESRAEGEDELEAHHSEIGINVDVACHFDIRTSTEMNNESLEFLVDLILKLDISRKLEKHRGCVNTVSFNAVGDILVSGSDDKKVILWNWENGQIKHSFHSGHHENVFQAKFMPYSGDSSIVSCAADGQVRHAIIRNSGGAETSKLGSHDGRAHKLAIEPASPHIFYTCGEDGLVQHFDLRTKASTELLTCHSIDGRRRYSPAIHLNAITIDPRNPNLFAVGGTDEYARLYDIRMYWDQWDGSNFDRPVNFFCPQHLIGVELVGITGLAFSDSSELLVSYNNENIYLFEKYMGLGPDPLPSSPSQSDTSELDPENSTNTSHANMDTDENSGPQVFKGHRNWDTVKGVSFCGPKCEYVVSGSDCGRIFIWRKKGGELIRVMEADKHVVNCIEPHPHISMLASSGIEHDIKIWTPKSEERATLPPNIGEVLLSHRNYFLAFDDEDDDEDDYDLVDDDDDVIDNIFDDDDDDDGGNYYDDCYFDNDVDEEEDEDEDEDDEDEVGDEDENEVEHHDDNDNDNDGGGDGIQGFVAVAVD